MPAPYDCLESKWMKSDLGLSSYFSFIFDKEKPGCSLSPGGAKQ